MPVLDPCLEAFLMLHATVSLRDEEAMRQALRHTANELEDRDAHQVVDLLNRTINPNDRRFLQSLA